MTKFAAYLIENKHSIGRIGDIMEILHVTNKGRPIDAIKMYHLNKETKQFNQINDKHPETEQNIRFRTRGMADRTHTHIHYHNRVTVTRNQSVSIQQCMQTEQDTPCCTNVSNIPYVQ